MVGPCLHSWEPGRTPESRVFIIRRDKKIAGHGLAKLPERHDDLILKHIIEISNLIAFKIAYNVLVFYRYVNIFICANIYAERGKQRITIIM